MKPKQNWPKPICDTLTSDKCLFVYKVKISQTEERACVHNHASIDTECLKVESYEVPICFNIYYTTIQH